MYAMLVLQTAGRWGRRKTPVWHDWAPGRSWHFPVSLGNTTRTKEPNTKVIACWLAVNCVHQRWVVTWKCLIQISKAFLSFYSFLKKRLQKTMELSKKNPKTQNNVLSSKWDHIKQAGIDRLLLMNKKLHCRSQWTQAKSADKSPLAYKMCAIQDTQIVLLLQNI